MPKIGYIFVTGGVVSSLGKGIASSALGALLQARGYKVILRKLDPYLNIDPGTMSPSQHGEVYVTEDGSETDLDLGHYERFTGASCSRADNTTSGQIYQKILKRERKGDYLGATVQVIPHVTDAIQEFIQAGAEKCDFLICEIGGTVGDIESLPFLEAIRQLANKLGREKSLFLHLTLLPYIESAGEMKTKPTQHSVKEMLSIGLQPDILLCRTGRPIQKSERQKISLFCNLREDRVIEGLDIDSIYEAPLLYYRQQLDKAVLDHFDLTAKAPAPKLKQWEEVAARMRRPEGEVEIAIVGKYVGTRDAYKSLIEALQHGGIAHRVCARIRMIDSEGWDEKSVPPVLSRAHGIIVPGGFGSRGSEGKIAAAAFARTRQVPFLGICFGMQMAVIEVARNLAGIKGADSSEFGPTKEPVVGLMTEWYKNGRATRRSHNSPMGGTMRLGAYPAELVAASLAAKIYRKKKISERHRHRYEVNINYRPVLEKHGVLFSGLSPDGLLPEIMEIPSHPWYAGVQFHPELKSRPLAPHPLFVSFIGAALAQSRLV